MNSLIGLIFGAVSILGFATMILVFVPFAQMRDLPPSENLKPYTETQALGRATYVDLGCAYCHSQQPRDPFIAPDQKRGWGPPSRSSDYVFDYPHQLGTMRTGPDLFNIAVRQPSVDWHLIHLYQPRAVVPWSIMPAYPFLFELKDKAEEGDKIVVLPPEHAPEGKVVVAKKRALNLVDYLLSLDHTYEPIPVNQKEIWNDER